MTEESPEEKPSQIDKLARRSKQQIDPADLHIKFPPHVRRELEEVIERVREKEAEVSGPLLKKLEKLASGKATVIEGMRFMADITTLMDRYSEETGYHRPRGRWDVFVAGLYRHHPNLAQPMTLEAKEKGRG